MRKVVLSFLLLLAGAAAPLVALLSRVKTNNPMFKALVRVGCFLFLFLIPSLSIGQTASSPFTAPLYYASAFGQWSVNGQSPNTYTFAGRSICNGSAQGLTFFDFNANAPVFIQDSNSANNEVATPSAVVNNAGSCGVSIAPSHNHYSFLLKSGTAGLQEAINTLNVTGGYPAVVALDRNWYSQANGVPGTSGASIITAAVGKAGVVLTDITAVPPVNYVWSGTAYASHAWVNTAPTAAAGAGAGSSPTISQPSAGSTALSGIVNLTTGTATTTGTLFTLTWVTNTLIYAGTCTITSVGANPYTTFTVADTAPSSLRLATVTVATTAPVASTAYSFSYNCI